MSLKHWWPLRGDFYDRVGGNHLQFPSGYNNGYIVANNGGKFGPCYERTAIAQADLLRSTHTIKPFAEESICGWFLVTEYAALGTANGLVTHHNHTTNSGLGIGMYSEDGSKYYVSINAGTGSGRIHSDPSYRGTTDIKGAWHHICLTYAADGKLRMYVDGKEDMTPRAYSLHNTADYFDLFNWSVGHYTSVSYRPKCKMCDIRIYDHALSPAEVQELAKGLALHYNFNQLSTANVCNWKDPAVLQSQGWGSVDATYSNGILTLRATNGWRSYMWDIGAANVGSPLTFSYEYRILETENAGYIYVQNHSSSGYGSSIQDLSLDTPIWQYKTVSVASAQQYIGFNIRGVDDTGKKLSMQIRNVKIALNNYDTLYTEYGQSLTRCPDDSGWNNVGLMHQISPSADNKKGNRSAYFNGNYSYIESPNFKQNLPNEDYTISFWINPAENGVRDIIYGNHAASTNSFNIERYTSNQLRIYYSTDTPGYINAATMLANEWTHIAIVRKGNSIQVWRNGVKVSDASYSLSTLTCSNAKYKIGSDYRTANASTEATRFKGKLDDFRIYVTALNEQDIKDLYESVIYMTNNDMFMANEFIEDNVIEMLNTSAVKATGLNEEIHKDYELLEYIASSGTQYINTNYIPKNNFKIELDMMWTGSTISAFETFAGFMHANQIPRAAIHKYTSVFMIGGNSTTVSTVAPVKDQRIVLTGDFCSGNQHLYKNGVVIVNDATALDLSANAQQVYIFGRNASGKNLATMRLYRGKIYDNTNTLVRDFIPARRKSDNVLGLYDSITTTFYVNSGTGSFSAGPTLSNDKISMYTSNNISAKEYIEI